MSRDFWSRRKAAVKAEEEAQARAAAEQEAAQVEAELAERSDEEILDELGLPDPDSMAAGDDFSVFLAKTVPARLRNRALRRLWLTNPVLANVDGLVDYGEDFTQASGLGEVIQTAYQVGRGMTRHVEALRQQEAEDAETGSDEALMAEDDAEPETAMVTSTDQAPAPAELSADLAETAPPDHSDPPPTVQRRMRFSFAEDAEQNA